jgi:hypothetical protein
MQMSVRHLDMKQALTVFDGIEVDPGGLARGGL